MAKRMNPPFHDRKVLPNPVQIRSGLKVAWYYYADKQTADQASEIARHNGQIDAAMGYDFGYQNPGSVRSPDQQTFYPGLWEVCVS